MNITRDARDIPAIGRRSASRSAAYDYAVVGTGPGGATVARELARNGHSVLILERGSAAPVRGRAGQTLRELLFPRRSLQMAGALTLLRGNTVGGSSIYFHGTAWDPPLDVLAAHGLDLRAEVEEVKRELAPAPLPVELMGPRARLLMDSARELGYEWEPIPKFFDQAELAKPPMGTYVAPSYGAKWNARRFVEEAVSHGAALATDAQVERVLVEDGVARGVEFVHGGARRQARAERVVVAAGGIGTPLILRASGIDRAGRDYFYDPFVMVMGALDGLDAGQELSMVAGAGLPDEDYLITDINTPPWWFAMDTILAGRPDRALSHRRSLALMVKAKDELSGAITSRGGLGKRLTPGDREKLSAGTERARQILGNAGARHIYRSGYAAVHPGGTAKVGDVVDENLQSQVRGLYVGDASAIPVAWGLPPTLTVLALGKKLGRHLCEEQPPGGARRSRSAAPAAA